MMTLKNLKPLDLVVEQYQLLADKLRSTKDAQEKSKLFRRLTNLLAVMKFLISLNKPP